MSSTRCLFAWAFGPLALAVVLGLPAAELPDAKTLPRERAVGTVELVAVFDGPMPTGVAVSHTGRIFVCFPRWGDPVDFTVAELKDGKAVAFPDLEINKHDPKRAADTFVSVQSVVVDARDRLWILDTGSVAFGPAVEGGPKLVGIDLATGRQFKKIAFPRDVVPETSYLNDVRFDLRHGAEGTAFITDSSGKGPNGIIVVDLSTGKSWRRLKDHPSTKAEPNFLPIVEGRPLMVHESGKKPAHMTMGADGIAIGHDGKFLFYCPLAGRRLYRVSTDALADERLSDEDVARTVTDLGDKGCGSDGLESDSEGRIYLTDYEHNAIQRRSASGTYDTVVHDGRILWPDTLCLATDGHLYFTANQLHRMGRFHAGKDQRKKPYSLFKVKVDAKPVLLK
jgi:sugar lactone lactonase YvrE